MALTSNKGFWALNLIVGLAGAIICAAAASSFDEHQTQLIPAAVACGLVALAAGYKLKWG